ncbi:hypothetical protein RQP46_008007 [Phenoliferia psychrophenolica]
MKLPRVPAFKLAITVTSIYMLAELIVGYKFNSLAMQVDSFHMLNDATMLLALCLTLTLESLQRFYSPEPMGFPPIVIGFGVFGFAWNIVLFAMLENLQEVDQGEAVDSSSRSVVDSLSIAHARRYRNAVAESARFHPDHHDFAYVEHRLPRAKPHLYEKAAGSHAHANHHHHHDEGAAEESDDSRGLHDPEEGPGWKERDGKGHDHDSTRALMVHVFGDTLGNIAVIIDGIFVLLLGPDGTPINGRLASWKGVALIDPLCSLFVVGLLLTHTLPLDLRIWSLNSKTTVGSVRLLIDAPNIDDIATVTQQAKNAFLKYGVKPEFWYATHRNLLHSESIDTLTESLNVARLR